MFGIGLVRLVCDLSVLQYVHYRVRSQGFATEVREFATEAEIDVRVDDVQELELLAATVAGLMGTYSPE